MCMHATHGIILSRYCNTSLGVCEQDFSTSARYRRNIQCLALWGKVGQEPTWMAYKLLVGASDCSNSAVKKSNFFHIPLESKWQNNQLMKEKSCSSIHKNGENAKTSLRKNTPLLCSVCGNRHAVYAWIICRRKKMTDDFKMTMMNKQAKEWKIWLTNYGIMQNSPGTTESDLILVLISILVVIHPLNSFYVISLILEMIKTSRLDMRSIQSN